MLRDSWGGYVQWLLCAIKWDAFVSYSFQCIDSWRRSTEGNLKWRHSPPRRPDTDNRRRRRGARGDGARFRVHLRPRAPPPHPQEAEGGEEGGQEQGKELLSALVLSLSSLDINSRTVSREASLRIDFADFSHAFMPRIVVRFSLNWLSWSWSELWAVGSTFVFFLN